LDHFAGLPSSAILHRGASYLCARAPGPGCCNLSVICPAPQSGVGWLCPCPGYLGLPPLPSRPRRRLALRHHCALGLCGLTTFGRDSLWGLCARKRRLPAFPRYDRCRRARTQAIYGHFRRICPLGSCCQAGLKASLPTLQNCNDSQVYLHPMERDLIHAL